MPIIHVLGAGRIGVYAGADLVASLEHGMIEATTTDVFNSTWLSNLFRGARSSADALVTDQSGRTNAELVRVVSQHMVRRAIFLIRQAGHGGLILFADSELVESCKWNPSAPLKVKYAFLPTEARSRYTSLLKRLFDVLARHGDGSVDLQRFLQAETPDVIGVEQSIF